MQTRFEFRGTGGELFKELFVGAILTMITFGIYMPWFIVKMQRYTLDNTTMRVASQGDLKLQFKGTGGDLFVVLIVGYLLTMITMGIYGFWFLANMIRFYNDNTTAVAPDGTRYGLKTEITGGDMFKSLIVGAILCGITFGIYLPWFVVKFYKLLASRTRIMANDRPHGSVDFVATGGDLAVTMLVGLFLCVITLQIYQAWFQVKMWKFIANHTEVTISNQTYSADFVGTGGDLFVINLVGLILTMLTLGIYSFWFMAKLIKFRTEGLVYAPARAPAYSQHSAQVPARA